MKLLLVACEGDRLSAILAADPTTFSKLIWNHKMSGIFMDGLELDTEQSVDCAFQLINSKGDAIDLISIERFGGVGFSSYKTSVYGIVNTKEIQVDIFIIKEHVKKPLIDSIKRAFGEGTKFKIHKIGESELRPLVLKYLNELIREDILATLEGKE